MTGDIFLGPCILLQYGTKPPAVEKAENLPANFQYFSLEDRNLYNTTQKRVESHPLC